MTTSPHRGTSIQILQMTTRLRSNDNFGRPDVWSRRGGNRPPRGLHDARCASGLPGTPGRWPVRAPCSPDSSRCQTAMTVEQVRPAGVPLGGTYSEMGTLVPGMPVAPGRRFGGIGTGLGLRTGVARQCDDGSGPRPCSVAQAKVGPGLRALLRSLLGAVDGKDRGWQTPFR